MVTFLTICDKGERMNVFVTTQIVVSGKRKCYTYLEKELEWLLSNYRYCSVGFYALNANNPTMTFGEFLHDRKHFLDHSIPV